MKKLTALMLFALFIFNCEAFALSLTKGTKVPVKAVNNISAEQVSVGQKVQFAAAKNVQDSMGKVAIKEGAAVTATVLSVSPKARIGKSASLTLGNFTATTTSATQAALDGSIVVAPDDIRARSIVLSVLVIPLFLLMHGAAAEIPAGSEYTLTVK